MVPNTWDITTETEMLSFCRNFRHWLHRKLSKFSPLAAPKVVNAASEENFIKIKFMCQLICGHFTSNYLQWALHSSPIINRLRTLCSKIGLYRIALYRGPPARSLLCLSARLRYRYKIRKIQSLLLSQYGSMTMASLGYSARLWYLHC